MQAKRNLTVTDVENFVIWQKERSVPNAKKTLIIRKILSERTEDMLSEIRMLEHVTCVSAMNKSYTENLLI